MPKMRCKVHHGLRLWEPGLVMSERPQKPKGTLTSLKKTACRDQINATLMEDGAVIISDLFDYNIIEQINLELDPALNGTEFGVRDEEVVGQTKRLSATLRYSPTLISDVVTHQILIDTAESALLDYTDTLQMMVVASEVVPGEESQALHRDDWNWGHMRGRSHPLSIFTIIALSEFTGTSGATRVIPGSHLWNDVYTPSTNKKKWRDGIYEELSLKRGLYDELAIPALLSPGDALTVLGTTIHGAGENKTNDFFRRALQVKYCMGWLRPPTNNYLLYPPDFAKTLPEQVQRLLGYQLEAKHLGWLEQNVDPITLLRA